jgi:hypothetical protein
MMMAADLKVFLVLGVVVMLGFLYASFGRSAACCSR